MTETSVTLLDQLRSPADATAWNRAWEELDRLYRPFLVARVIGAGIQPTDAEDVAQEVLLVVREKMPNFERNRSSRPGSFRTWLRHVTANCRRTHVRKGTRGRAEGGDDALEQLRNLEDPDSDMSRIWDREHQRHRIRHAMQTIRADFAESSWAGFTQVCMEGKPAVEVAAEMGINPSALYSAIGRIKARLEEELGRLPD